MVHIGRMIYGCWEYSDAQPIQDKTENLPAARLLVLVVEKLMHEWENKRKG